MDCDVMSDARIFDVAKGVLVATRGCGLNEALAELIGVAERYHVGVLALARALVGLAAPGVKPENEHATLDAATSAWGDLFPLERSSR
ncbi:MAG TPA: ANTAR domain-containing protein [Mycobacterium sp.]